MSELSIPSELQFRQLVSILRRRKALILGTAASITTLVCIVVLLYSFQYTAIAQLEIEPQQTGLVGGQVGVFQQPADAPSVQTEITAISSQDHLRVVLDSLSNDPLFRATLDKTEAVPTGSSNWWVSVSSWARDVWLTAIGASGEFTLRQLEHNLDVYQEHGSHSIAVSFRSIRPDEAAFVANRVAQLYVERRGEQKRAATDRALAWISKQIPELGYQVGRLEEVRRAYKVEHNQVNLNPAMVANQQLAELSRQLSEAKADLSAQKARLATVRNLRANGKGMSAVVEYLGSPTLAELRRRESALLASENSMGFNMPATNPRMQLIQSQLREIQSQIGLEIDGAVAHLDMDVQVSSARVQSIELEFKAIQGASTDERLNLLNREVDTMQQLRQTLLLRQEELQQQHQSLSAGIHVLSRAWPPSRPTLPNPLLFVIPALVGSLFCGSLIAVAREQLDTTLRGEQDVIVGIGLPCIGLLPYLRRLGNQRPHEYLLNKPFDPYTEGIRSVLASLRLLTQNHSSRAILVTSSVPGEGKTTLAVSLATYAAVLGKRVLLLDLDFRHPNILRELGGNAGPGILDLVKLGSSDVIQHSQGLQFDYLPIGRVSVDPLTPFTDERLPRLLQEFRQRYDCVVIDSAPLLAITEVRFLASMVDKVVFVVKWASTRQEVAQNAIRILHDASYCENNRPDIAGVVMTQVDLKKHARYRYGDSGEITMRYKRYYS